MKNKNSETKQKSDCLLAKLEVKPKINSRSYNKYTKEITKGRIQKLNDIDNAFNFINLSDYKKKFNYLQVGIIKLKNSELKRQLELNKALEFRQNDAVGKITRVIRRFMLTKRRIFNISNSLYKKGKKQRWRSGYGTIQR